MRVGNADDVLMVKLLFLGCRLIILLLSCKWHYWPGLISLKNDFQCDLNPFFCSRTMQVFWSNISEGISSNYLNGASVCVCESVCVNNHKCCLNVLYQCPMDLGSVRWHVNQS